MKKFLTMFLLVLLLAGCGTVEESGPTVAATTYPVAQFTEAVCAGTDIQVNRIITDSVSCLHDYSLTVNQAKTVERADVIVLSGAGLESFMADVFADKECIDSSAGIALLEGDADHDGDSDAHGEGDPHIWLSPENAKAMVHNIADGLSQRYPDLADTFAANAAAYAQKLDALQQEGTEMLQNLSCRELVTFHDGFAYFAEAFDLDILAAVEEESGAEASAADLKQIGELVHEYNLPGVFTEVYGSNAAAGIIAAETGCKTAALDLGMGDCDYETAMRNNFAAIAEVLA